ncbi:MAG: winged helix-turn-helix transcriptional regulator [Kordiimonadaceae bacterium]|nr:winged helix-turn-helix transcriptional regulator [Kordiimonadaceae bacterium]
MKHIKDPSKLDKLDIKILSALSRDGRMTKLQLSEEVSLSATPCWGRMKKLEKSGIIKGYHAAFDIRSLAGFFILGLRSLSKIIQ